MKNYSWKNTDPRLQVDSFARIVIIRPSPQGHGILEVQLGDVATEHTYCVFTKDFVGVDDKWDEAWWWTWAPELPR